MTDRLTGPTTGLTGFERFFGEHTGVLDLVRDAERMIFGEQDPGPGGADDSKDAVLA